MICAVTASLMVAYSAIILSHCRRPQSVGLVIDKWGVANQCAMVRLAKGVTTAAASPARNLAMFAAMRRVLIAQ
jgi:predicted 3-demethylubiquinone-9 3-methyltransferase (glyoxalase superfamily)